VACSILSSNGKAEQLLSDGQDLTLSRDILGSRNPVETTRLRSLAIGEAGAGGSMEISRGSGRTPLQLLVVRLRQKESSFFPSECPAALVFVTDPDCEVRPRVPQIRQRYGLTAAEAAFAVEIIKGEGIQSASDRLAISKSTGRTHLASIFAKTGTHRQAELVRLMRQGDRGLQAVQ